MDRLVFYAEIVTQYKQVRLHAAAVKTDHHNKKKGSLPAGLYSSGAAHTGDPTRGVSNKSSARLLLCTTGGWILSYLLLQYRQFCTIAVVVHTVHKLGCYAPLTYHRRKVNTYFFRMVMINILVMMRGEKQSR